MTNIKVTYKSITRRLGISSTTAWSELESQFHTLFNIPQEIPITVSYTDEEGDDITLSSDLELQEALSNPSNKTIKFVLKTPDEKKKSHNVDTAMDEATSSLIHGVSAIHLQETDHQDHVHNQETRGETSKKAAETTDDPEENQDSSDEDEIIVIITRNHGRSRSEAQRFRGWNPYTFGRRSRHASLSGCNPSSRSSRGCGNRRRHQISPEVMTEKLNLLHSMGFFNDNLEELVRRYNGNLEQVIEVLLLDRREEQSDERNKERDVGGVREEDGKQSMEVEENNTAYDL